MWTSILLLFTCFCTVNLVHALLVPASDITGLARDIQEAHVGHSVSTTFSLGRPWADSAVQSQDGLRPSVASTASNIAYVLNPAMPYTKAHSFTHSRYSAFRSLAEQPSVSDRPTEAAVQENRPAPESSAAMHLPSSSAYSDHSLEAQSSIIQHQPSFWAFPVTPQLDTFPGTSLRHTQLEGYIYLPKEIKYVPSLWFDSFYQRLTQSFTRSTVYEAPKIPLDATTVKRILDQEIDLLSVWSNVYKIRIPGPALSYEYAPGEVFVRFHKNVTYNGARFTNRLSVWSSTNDGDSLAFLGLYHCRGTVFQNFLKHTIHEEFQVKHSIPLDTIYLDPIPRQA